VGESSSDDVELAIRCLDLTSLEGTESPEQINALCERAVTPDPASSSVPSVAAVVLYPQFVAMAAERLKGTGVKVATVNGFPAPTEPLAKRLAEIHAAIDAGADEMDIVLDREAFVSGRRDAATEAIRRAKEEAGPATLKVILETGELGREKLIRDASTLAMAAGADFLKTSTGKVAAGATPDAARAMMRAVREYSDETDKAVGVKISGGVRAADQAFEYIALVEAELGSEWLTPGRFRIGASSLLDDLLARRPAGGGA
jgi:deoxyribose-phosphate aldolase